MRVAPKATKGKGLRWKRGGSSSSNPTTNKFRQKAKASAFGAPALNVAQPIEDIDESNRLTVEALANHNAFNLQNLSLGQGEDDGQTVVSFASAWSKCTNPSFERFLNGWQSTSALHKEMLAVLGSVTEAIKASNGKETETEYFAVLMTTIESVETEESLTAAIQLLRMVLKRVPQSVLRFKFGEASTILVGYLKQYEHSDNATLLKGLIVCLASLLRAQDLAVWSLTSTEEVFASLLHFTQHSKPRIRKAAHKTVVGIVVSNAATKPVNCEYHPSAVTVANFCVHRMEETGLKDETTQVLYSIGLLKDVIHLLPQSAIKSSSESMLRFMTLGNVLIITCCFQAFHALFSAKPQTLSPELNDKLLLALRDFQPSLSDSQPLAAWLTVVHEGLNCIRSLKPTLYHRHASQTIEIYLTCWLSDSAQVQAVVASNMKAIIANCVLANEKASSDLLERTCRAVQSCLSYQYNNAWGSVISVITSVIELLGKRRPEIVTTSLKILSELRENERFSQKAELDRAVAAAIKTVGPETVVEAIPLHLEIHSTEFSKSWLLILLRDNVSKAHLSFYAEYFMKLATQASQAIAKLRTDGREVDAKAMSIFYNQIFQLLPSFCNEPVDLLPNLKLIAKRMGTLLADREIRPQILLALRTLIRTCTKPDEQAELGRYAKNYLPLLLNLYTSETEEPDRSKRLAILATVACFMDVAPHALVKDIFNKAKERLGSASDSLSRVALLDVMRVLIPSLEQSELEQTKLIVSELIDKKKTAIEQKKGYRMLEEICKCNVDSSRSFVDDNLANILTTLMNGLKHCSPSSTSAPLNALNVLIDRYFQSSPRDSLQVIMKILPQAIASLLIKSTRTSHAALNLLSTIATMVAKCDDGLNQLYSYLMVSLSQQDESESLSAVITATTHLLPVMKASVPTDGVHKLCKHVLGLLASQNRKTVQTSLSFLKAMFKEFDKNELLPFVAEIVSSLDAMTPSNRSHFRTPIKETFTRLCRKFGNEMISRMVPQSFSKVLRNIRKSETRKTKKNERQNKDEDDEQQSAAAKTAASERDAIDVVLQDSDDDDAAENNDADDYVDAKQQSRTWIEEKGDEEILDLLSTNVNRKILSANPFRQKLTREKRQSAFNTAADGRLIIPADLDGEASPVGQKRPREELDESDEAGIDDEVAGEVDDDGEDGHDSDQADKADTALKYQHGGKGIHREPIKKRQQQKEGSIKTGKEYRSEKARGDMKKKGLPDPYAYVPLDMKALNKRKRAKYAGQFKNIMRAAKQGASLGTKNKRQRRS